MLVFVSLSKVTCFLKIFGYFYLKDTHTHTLAHMRSVGMGAESGWTLDSVPLTPPHIRNSIRCNPVTPYSGVESARGSLVCGPWICCHAHSLNVPPCSPRQLGAPLGVDMMTVPASQGQPQPD